MHIIVWDIWTRLFHWGLVICILFLLYSGKTGSGFFDWHRFAGEVALALICFRLCWGLWGSSNNRLNNFFANPLTAVTHLMHLFSRSVTPERGHNAAGGWASFAMICLIALQAITGLFISDEDELIEGAFYADISSSWSEQLLQIHYFNSSLIIALVVVHISMVIIYRIWGRLNLIKPMITGRMAWPESLQVPNIIVQHWLAGLVTAIAVFTIIGLTVGWIDI